MKNKSNSLFALSLVAILSTGMFSFASANTQTEEKSKVVVAESKEFQELNTNAQGEASGYFIAWTKNASSAIIAWDLGS